MTFQVFRSTESAQNHHEKPVSLLFFLFVCGKVVSLEPKLRPNMGDSDFGRFGADTSA